MAGNKKVKSEAGENPLVPNARLRAIYTTMVQARTLEEELFKRSPGPPRKNKPVSIRGQEAIRASTVLQLGSDDLISDAERSAGMESILGGDAALLLKTFSSPKMKHSPLPRLMPIVSEPEQRLQMALGAALALKTQGKQGVVIAYIRKDELSANAYRRILLPAAANELPVIFVVLPRQSKPRPGDGEATVAKVAGKAGVPGIPVDACDSVALYRVAQESLGRSRGADGPVLIECIQWKQPGGSKRAIYADPIDHLKDFLAGRKIADSAWFKQQEDIASRRLRRKQKASKKT